MLSASLQLEILYRISQALAHHHDVDAMLQESLDILETELGFRRGTITLKLQDEEILRIIASKGLTQREVKRGQYTYGEGITGRVAETLEAAVIPNISEEPAFLSKTVRRDEDRSFICVPIIRQKELMGTISIDRPTGPVDELEADLSFMKILANILAEAVGSMRALMEERESLIAENRMLRQELGEQYRPSNIIGNCAGMKSVYKQIAQVADSPANVLVRGESGTGKELVARALHYGSTRRNNPFISVNLAALPEGLMESEDKDSDGFVSWEEFSGPKGDGPGGDEL